MLLRALLCTLLAQLFGWLADRAIVILLLLSLLLAYLLFVEQIRVASGVLGGVPFEFLLCKC